MRVCSKCSVEKPEKGFYVRGDGRLYQECRDCMRAAAKAYYEANPEYQKTKAKEWRESNPERVKEYRAANRRKSYLRESARKYGITSQQFEEMMAAQAAACKTCGKLFDWGDKQTKPHIDHCHGSGKVRGLLCNRCNTVLGLVNENKNILSTLIEYLTCHGTSAEQ